MIIKDDLKQFPVFKYENGKLIQIEPPEWWDNTKVECHHFIKKQIYNRNPAKYKNIQKLIFLPKQMHREADAYHSKFKEKYKIELTEVIYRR
jgi:hypothetical protein